ncbi:isochorismatase family protein [Nocardioides sp. B-3]|uniref:isochorismatase family protein n=1 Tax=Nocardioides sp. B-3 TaxID=2895565 RepID=UPI0021526BF2|nr:isochorismatase family protein [Nocardioides sp. B-3]UUZ59496.1 isochorismatase family protein [Nocardioides sp. B-3]
MSPTVDEIAASWSTEVHERYARGGLAGRLTPRGAVALIVVDLQNGFTDPACGPGFDPDDVVTNTASLIERARTAGVPVHFTAIAFPDGSDRVWLEKMPVMRELREGSRWERIDPRLAVGEGEPVVIKQTASSFAGTDLTEQLRAQGVGTVVVVGATTSGCVRATAVDACALDFATYVVDGAVGDREAGPHEAALLDTDAKYADVVSMDVALRLLGGVA